MALLNIRKLSMRFGGLTAVDQLDLQVEQGQIFSVIGPNGAGKTTVFNAVTGIYRPTEGKIAIAGREPIRPFSWKMWTACLAIGFFLGLAAVLVTIGPDGLVSASVKQVMEPGKPFSYTQGGSEAWGYLWGAPALQRRRSGKWSVLTPDGKKTLKITATRGEAVTVRAELARLPEVIAFQSARVRWVWIAFGFGFSLGFIGNFAVWLHARRTPETGAQAGIARTFQNIRLFKKMTALENVQVGIDRAAQKTNSAFELLRFVGLDDQADQLAGDLPYGHQRRLEIARALATGPKLLLLDEPAAGMNPSEASALMELIQTIRDQGITVLLIEHHMHVVMGISDRIAVLDHGVKIAEGTPEEIRNDPQVIEAYLGKDEEEAA